MSGAATVLYACQGKKTYESYATAERALKRIRHSKGRERDRSSLNIYRCKFCRDWHIGSYEKVGNDDHRNG